MKPIAIVGAKRTPIGSFQGALSPMSACDLGSTAISAALKESTLDSDKINEVIMGCVLPAGLGQAPARQAALGANLPINVSCTTVNKVCGSGMKSIMIACDTINADHASFVIAGGMESMSNAPYLLPKARSGFRMGHAQAIDHMFYDGLQNAYDNKLMGIFAEQCANKYSYTREAQDSFSIESVTRAMHAIESGLFQAEITPVQVKTRKEIVEVKQDEEPLKCNLDKVSQLKPAFDRENGTVTAANASKISDGAAATVLTSHDFAVKHNLTIKGKIVGYANHAQEPEWFTTAPAHAIQKLQNQLDWSNDDVDLYEINEAFACVTMAAMQELKLDHNKVNINGGACALGHPIGATGARLVVTLVHALKQYNKKRGIAALCIGGGEATAIAIEVE